MRLPGGQEVLGVIPARGGSKGVPRKNIRPLCGVPLIAYTIRAAQACPRLSDVVVSTDDQEIQKIAVEQGASAPFLRPPELATDRALSIATVQHAVREMESRRGRSYDYVAMLQPTTPLRTADDLTEALTRLIESGADGIISIIDVDNWHPMKMKRLLGDRLVDYEKPPVENPPRQILPTVYMVNGAIYATKRDVLMNRGTFQGDYCLGYVMPSERSVNIDSQLDFLMAEHLLKMRTSSL
ncbi:MAG: acylneuraminate cytidylyltransferase family protein [Desulfobacteraceae bacterium]|nr:MAG: acylneuraminate cytidylyltransferase family protein [Desulfobacteraceae bacterium]